ncbi:MAG: phosphoribosylpyrophosphate synthetase [Nitrospiraceae bacterium]
MALKGYKTMAEAVEDLRKRGFAANFEFLDKTFKAVNTGKTFRPDELVIVEHHRFEGVSDPDDMSVLYVIEANDGTRGTIADAFGPQADPELGAFLKTVKMHEGI